MTKVITNLTIGEQCALFKTLGEFYQRRAAALENATLNAHFASMTEKNEGVILASNKQDNSAKLDKADAERDEAVRKFFTIAEGATAQVDAEEAAAGEALLKVLNGYGRKITSLSFSEETTKIESLFKDLDKEENAAVLAKIHGGVAAKERLRKAQDAFLALYADKSSAATAASAEKSASALKKELRDYYNQTLVPYLQAMGVLEGEKYNPLIKELDAEVAKVNAASRLAQQQQKQPQADSKQAQQPQAVSQQAN